MVPSRPVSSIASPVPWIVQISSPVPWFAFVSPVASRTHRRIFFIIESKPKITTFGCDMSSKTRPENFEIFKKVRQILGNYLRKFVDFLWNFVKILRHFWENFVIFRANFLEKNWDILRFLTKNLRFFEKKLRFLKKNSWFFEKNLRFFEKKVRFFEKKVRFFEKIEVLHCSWRKCTLLFCANNNMFFYQ